MSPLIVSLLFVSLAPSCATFFVSTHVQLKTSCPLLIALFARASLINPHDFHPTALWFQKLPKVFKSFICGFDSDYFGRSWFFKSGKSLKFPFGWFVTPPVSLDLFLRMITSLLLHPSYCTASSPVLIFRSGLYTNSPVHGLTTCSFFLDFAVFCCCWTSWLNLWPVDFLGVFLSHHYRDPFSFHFLSRIHLCYPPLGLDLSFGTFSLLFLALVWFCALPSFLCSPFSVYLSLIVCYRFGGPAPLFLYSGILQHRSKGYTTNVIGLANYFISPFSHCGYEINGFSFGHMTWGGYCEMIILSGIVRSCPIFVKFFPFSLLQPMKIKKKKLFLFFSVMGVVRKVVYTFNFKIL